MAWTQWLPRPPQYVRRWAVQGVKSTGDRATTTFDLRADLEHVAVYPATVDTFALLIDHTTIQPLLDTLQSQDTCAVPGIHAIHGRRQLGLRPYDTPFAERSWIDPPPGAPPYHGPMELYVHLPSTQVHIIYGREQLPTLHAALTEILHRLL